MERYPSTSFAICPRFRLHHCSLSPSLGEIYFVQDVITRLVVLIVTYLAIG
jgi:hypothetical protein